MKLGLRRVGSCRWIPGLACVLWLCSLLPAAAAQPAADVPPAVYAIDNPFFALPTADPFVPSYAQPTLEGGTAPLAEPLAQNTPRLYSVRRVGIEPEQETDGPERWQWSLATGYRQDDLQWNIGGHIWDNDPPYFWFQYFLPDLDPSLAGRYVNILSELQWTDVEVLQFEFGLQRRWDSNFHLSGLLGYGIVVDGQVQDSDYVGDNRTLEFSRSNNGADKGDVWDAYVTLGYDFVFRNDFLTLTPLGGFSYHAQNFSMVDGVQTVSNFGFDQRQPLGPFPGLDSSYDADWYGPWIGGELSFTFKRKDLTGPAHRIWFGGEWHFYAEYSAKADWNLRAEFAHPVSFEHESDGWGAVAYGGYSWFVDSRWALDLKAKYQLWETDPGIDRVFGADGSSLTTVLNEVEWDSLSATIGISCRW